MILFNFFEVGKKRERERERERDRERDRGRCMGLGVFKEGEECESTVLLSVSTYVNAATSQRVVGSF